MTVVCPTALLADQLSLSRASARPSCSVYGVTRDAVGENRPNGPFFPGTRPVVRRLTHLERTKEYEDNLVENVSQSAGVAAPVHPVWRVPLPPLRNVRRPRAMRRTAP